jgi:glutamine synthetase
MWFKSIDSVNPLERSLNKRSENFTKEDIIKYVQKNNIKILNFRYTAYDGRLKTLNFPVTDREYLNTILTSGERVDGSSLFPFVEAFDSNI